MPFKNGISDRKEENLPTGLCNKSFCVRLMRFLKEERDEKEPHGSLG